MTRFRTLAIVSAALVAAGAAAPSPSHAQSATANAQGTQDERSAKKPLAFRPPTRGAPTRRVGGATRSDAVSVALTVLAPETLAYSATPSPTLYWRLDGPAPNLTLTVIEDGAIDPLVEADLGPAEAGGVMAAPLSRFGAALEPNRTYEWSVSVIVDPDARSEDIVSSATIRHAPDESLGRDVEALAANGYWYDLIAALLGSDPAAATAEDRALFDDLVRDAGLAP